MNSQQPVRKTWKEVQEELKTEVNNLSILYALAQAKLKFALKQHDHE